MVTAAETLGLTLRRGAFQITSSFQSGRFQALSQLVGGFTLSHDAGGLEVLSLSRFPEDAGLLHQLIELP
jgi:hypothetical protein